MTVTRNLGPEWGCEEWKRHRMWCGNSLSKWCGVCW